MAAAPGGTGPPTMSQYPSPRRTRTAARSEKPRGQCPPILPGAWVLWTEYLEQVEIPLPRHLVFLHFVEQLGELRFDIANRGCVWSDASQCRDASCLRALR